MHDNGSRPFRVFVDHKEKKIHIYSLNQNLIFDKKTNLKDYTHSDVVRFSVDVPVQLAMNPLEEEEDPTTTDEEEDQPTNDAKSFIKSTNSQDEYYDQLVGVFTFKKIWIPDGIYTTRNDNGYIGRFFY